MSRRPSDGGRRGGNAVEFALLMPLMLVMFSAVVDYSWVLMHENAARAAARAGARAGATTLASEDPESAAVDAAAAAYAQYGVPEATSIIAFRTTDPVLMTVRVVVDLQMVIGLVPLSPQIERTAVEAMEVGG